MKALGKNPLLRDEKKEDPVLSEKDVETIKAAVSDADNFATMSFKIRKTHLKKLRNYAFTNRLEIKEALDEALTQYLNHIDDNELMEYPERPKKTRKRGFKK